jgi:hypothetical protein
MSCLHNVSDPHVTYEHKQGWLKPTDSVIITRGTTRLRHSHFLFQKSSQTLTSNLGYVNHCRICSPPSDALGPLESSHWESIRNCNSYRKLSGLFGLGGLHRRPLPAQNTFIDTPIGFRTHDLTVLEVYGITHIRPCSHSDRPSAFLITNNLTLISVKVKLQNLRI